MKKISKLLCSAIIPLMSISTGAIAASVDVHVACNEPTVEISPVLYGIFFEDINFAADGGLYAELVQNRSFEYYPVLGGQQYHPLYAWEKVEAQGGNVELAIDKMVPLNRNNPNYMTVRVRNAGDGSGFSNSGYDGINLDAGASYDFSIHARRDGRRGISTLKVSLVDENGSECGSTTINGIEPNWKKLTSVIKSSKTVDNAKLAITTTENGTFYVDMVSLFPQDTFKGRKNGLRKDLAQALEDLQPKFFRFPGGCIAHGHSLQNAYRWKDSVGDVAERRGNWNRWTYHQTYGLGFYEYFLLCEDIGAEPLPVVPIGVSCGFNEPFECVPLGELQPWIDDATDLIEFANGPLGTKWGNLRAQMGHPEPFNLKYLCLGNEEHDTPEMRERFPYFVDAVREAYPEIHIVGTSGLGAGIPIYDLMTEEKVYSSDEHYYMPPQWYLANQNRFDDFDRSAPKIFVGEYASEGNALFNAVSEAAFLTGVERNGDIVDMACYAPLFARYGHTQWMAANMIWFDKRTVVKTPNYYVQQLFSRNQGDVYLSNSVEQKKEPAAVKEPTIAGGVGIATWSTSIEVAEAKVNGKKLNPADWKAVRGDFQMKNGNYAQLDTNQQPAICFGETKYEGNKVTYTVKAKKTGGVEGFMLVFGSTDDNNYYWWNVGGWNNTQHAIEKTVNGAKSVMVQKRGSIENNKWYTMKVVLTPGNIKCYLNDELIHDYSSPEPTVSVSSTYDKDSNEVIVKLVNPSDKAINATIFLDGVSKVRPEAQLMVVSGEANDKNDLSAPENIKTEYSKIKAGKKFKYEVPAMSVQFIKVKAK